MGCPGLPPFADVEDRAGVLRAIHKPTLQAATLSREMLSHLQEKNGHGDSQSGFGKEECSRK